MRLFLCVFIVVHAGCGYDYPARSCSADDQCLLHGVPGTCEPSPLSAQNWCVFPNAECSSGKDWGPLTGDGLSRQCTILSADAAVPDAATDAASPDASPVPPVDAAPDATPADAGPYDFACSDDPPATTAPGTISFSGSVRSGIVFTDPVVGAAVQMRRLSTAELLSSATSMEMGMFVVLVATGGVPVDAYARVTHASFPEHRFVPAGPASADLSMGTLYLYDDMGWDDLAMVTGVTRDPTKGSLVVNVLDCTGTAVDGAAITLAPPSGTPFVSPEGTYIFNVEPGLTTISATGFGHTFRSRTITVSPDVATWVWLRP